jgi:hypothetical protein
MAVDLAMFRRWNNPLHLVVADGSPWPTPSTLSTGTKTVVSFAMRVDRTRRWSHDGLGFDTFNRPQAVIGVDDLCLQFRNATSPPVARKAKAGGATSRRRPKSVATFEAQNQPEGPIIKDFWAFSTVSAAP